MLLQARPYIVVGRFYSVGTAMNQLFAKLEDYPDMSSSVVTKTGVALADLFAGADMTKYWAYKGSLTTPGCDQVGIQHHRRPRCCCCCCCHHQQQHHRLFKYDYYRKLKFTSTELESDVAPGAFVRSICPDASPSHG